MVDATRDPAVSSKRQVVTAADGKTRTLAGEVDVCHFVLSLKGPGIMFSKAV